LQFQLEIIIILSLINPKELMKRKSGFGIEKALSDSIIPKINNQVGFGSTETLD